MDTTNLQDLILKCASSQPPGGYTDKEIIVDDICASWDTKAKAFKPTKELQAVLLEYMQEKGIEYFEAPFEADWQLVKFEQSGYIYTIMSTDEDCIILGAKEIIVQKKMKTLDCYVFEQKTEH